MTVTLKAISRPVDDSVAPNTGALLAYFARVSSANQANHETGAKLLRTLVKRREWSPFEMVSMTVEIITTRDIARQILRHRSFSFQEFSQRYAKVEEEFVTREARLQHSTDRQQSVEVEDENLQDWWVGVQNNVAGYTKQAYDLALSRGIAKEVARAVLPEGMTPSKLYMAGTLRSWIHYVMLRGEYKTQKEHRLIAEDCAKIIMEQFPELAEYLVIDHDSVQS